MKTRLKIMLLQHFQYSMKPTLFQYHLLTQGEKLIFKSQKDLDELRLLAQDNEDINQN